MDNRKIGKLIADLRKKQGLTQQELGDKVGVGFRAVSKWERGLTLPDISIINDVSKILGISSDELLSGKIKKENKFKSKKLIPTKVKLIIAVVVLVIIILLSAFIYFNNKTYVYNIYSVDQDNYYIEGQTFFFKNKISMIINKVSFKDKEFNNVEITNYEYDLISNNEYIWRYGYSPMVDNLEQKKSIEQFSETFNINNVTVANLSKEEIIKNNIILLIKFKTVNGAEIIKKIEIELKEK